MSEPGKRGAYFPWSGPWKDTGVSIREYAVRAVREGGRTVGDVAQEIGCKPGALRAQLRATRPGVPFDPPNPAARQPGQVPAYRAGATASEDDEGPKLPADVTYLLKANERLQKKIQEMRLKDDIIVQAYREAAKALPPVDILPWNSTPKEGRPRPHVAKAPVFDVQIGTFITPSDVAGLAEFNMETFYDRCCTWTEKVMRLTNLHRNSYDVDVLEVDFGGDMVEGETIFIGQPHHIDSGVYDQAMKGATAFAWALRKLVEVGGFRKIRCRCIVGNHGRPGRKGENHPVSNWDHVFYRFLEALCQNIPQIEFYISRSSFMAYHIPEAPKFVWLLAHGDNIKSSFSIPYYGFDRAVRNYTLLTNLPIDYMLVGHHHRQAQIDGVRGRQFMSGNWVGGSGFAINELQTAGHAKQLFLIVHPENGVVASHDIILWQMEPMKRNENGIYTTVQDPMRPLPAAGQMAA